MLELICQTCGASLLVDPHSAAMSAWLEHHADGSHTYHPAGQQ